jgi:hypothetical protein
MVVDAGMCKDRGYAFLISQDLPSKPASITEATALIALERIFDPH